MSSEPILSFHDVAYGYAKDLPEAVSHLDFDIPAGQHHRHIWDPTAPGRPPCSTWLWDCSIPAVAKSQLAGNLSIVTDVVN